MDELTKKYLTENVLGEKWIDEDGIDSMTANILASLGEEVPSGVFNRTFSTESDMMALCGKIFEAGKWEEFLQFISRKTKGSYFSVEDGTGWISGNSFSIAWLFCLSGEGYEERCEMIAEFRKGGNNG